MDTVDTRAFFADDTLHILPTFLRVEEEMRTALDASPRDALFGRKVFTFPQLIERIYEEIPGVQTILSPPGQLVLIERILHRFYKDKEDGYFMPLITTASLSSALLTIINHLKKNDISTDQCDDIVSRWEGGDTRKLGELALLYRRYQMSLKRSNLVDVSDVNWAVKHFVADQKHQVSLLQGVHTLIIEDIYDFTPAQFDLILAMAHRVEHTTVIIPFDHDRDDIFSYVERTIKKFESLWELTVDINLDFKPQRDASGRTLQKILDRCLKSDDNRVGELVAVDEEVILIEAAGMYREAEAIGKEIRKLLDSGIKPHTIGVLFRDISLYSEMIEDVFRRFRIPLYFRRGKPLLSNNLVKTILSIFDVLDTNFERDTFLKILRSNYVDCTEGKHPLVCEKMEWYLLKAGIIDDRDNAWEDKLMRLSEKMKGTIPACADGVHASESQEEWDLVTQLKNRVLHIKREIEVFRKNTTLGTFSGALKRLIHTMGLPHTIMCSEDEDSVKRDSASLNTIEEILDALTITAKQLALEDQTFTYHYFRTLLLKFMEERFILAGRESAQGVKVLNLYESRGLTFDYLFLGGGAENPSPREAWEDPFFNDKEKAHINHIMGRKIFLLKDEIGEEEPLLFYLGLSCARKRLYLSFSQIDARGYTVLPSFYLSEVMRLLGGYDHASVRTDQGLIVPPFTECYEEEEIENRLALTIWSPFVGESGETDSSSVEEKALTASLFNRLMKHDRFRRAFKKIFYCAEIEKTRELFFLEEDLARRKHTASVWAGMLKERSLLKELQTFFEKGEGRLWSPTYFERYTGCPFRFFLERVLKVYPLKIPAEDIERADEGSLIHTVLERFFILQKRDNLLPLRGTEEEKHRIHKVADEVYQQWEEQGTIGNKDLWEIRKKKSAPLWDRFIEEESRYQHEALSPTYFEFLIGRSPDNETPAAMPALVFHGFDHHEIQVGGKIDRIDCGPHTMRIIDYKNSRSDRYYQDLLRKEKLGTAHFQIPVYLAAAKEFMAEHHTINVMEGTFYLFRSATRTKPAVFKSSDPFFEKDLKKRMELREQGKENLFDRIAVIVGAVKSGDYSISPQDCTFCTYDRVCRFVSLDINGGEHS
jgi:ATP-dependent helicase/DNAse subunit B